MTANDRQVGGEHYRRGGTRTFQHWDLMATLDARYFPAVITKYTERHGSKAGRQDLEKAVHYAEKEHETESARRSRGQGRLRYTPEQKMAVASYCREAGLDPMQTLIFHTALLEPDQTSLLVTLCGEYLEQCYPIPGVEQLESEISDQADLLMARALVTEPVQEAIAEAATEQMKQDFAAEAERPGTPEDGGHHARTVRRR